MGSPAGAVPVKFTTPGDRRRAVGADGGRRRFVHRDVSAVSASSPPPPHASAATSRLAASASMERLIIVLLGLIRFASTHAPFRARRCARLTTTTPSAAVNSVARTGVTYTLLAVG